MASSTIGKLLTGEIPLDFNWNCESCPGIPIPDNFRIEPTAGEAMAVEIVSEDLRDGLHGIPTYPSVFEMARYIAKLAALGINYITVGMYTGGASKIHDSIKELLAYLAANHPDVTPIVLTLATEDAVAWAGSCHEINPRLSALIFMGTAPSRLLVEEWDRAYILKTLGAAIKEATTHYGINVTGATEHTTQTPPDFLADVINTAVKNGARSFCIADTVGTARPIGVIRIVKYVRKILKALNAENVAVEWHGHDDLGNGTANALASVAAGANRVHTVARGIGERAGNTRMESVILNLAEIITEAGETIPWKTEFLHEILTAYDNLTNNPVPYHGPLGSRAFRTSLGIHTSAMLKAELLVKSSRESDQVKLAGSLEKMARKIYSAIDPATVGRKHEIHVGPWSGKSTVVLAHMHLKSTDQGELTEMTIDHILTTAKKLGRELTTEELVNLLQDK